MTKNTQYTRREMLKASLTAGGMLTLAGCGLLPTAVTHPGGDLRAINVHPYVMDNLMPVQLEALGNIRANWVRTTLGILTDSAGPYVKRLQANLLGLIADFDLGPIDKNDWPDMIMAVIRRHPSIQYFQILNEPEFFNDIANREYVLDFLRPAHDLIRREFPHVKIVSAAPIGQPSGIQDFWAMSEAGADAYCDFRAVHIYFEESLLDSWYSFRQATEKPIMVTETGIRRPSEHLNWWQNQILTMKQILRTDYVFYYVLLDYPNAKGFDLITGQRDSQGNVMSAPESTLYTYLAR